MPADEAANAEERQTVVEGNPEGAFVTAGQTADAFAGGGTDNNLEVFASSAAYGSSSPFGDFSMVVSTDPYFSRGGEDTLGNDYSDIF